MLGISELSGGKSLDSVSMSNICIQSGTQKGHSIKWHLAATLLVQQCFRLHVGRQRFWQFVYVTCKICL